MPWLQNEPRDALQVYLFGSGSSAIADRGLECTFWLKLCLAEATLLRVWHHGRLLKDCKWWRWTTKCWLPDVLLPFHSLAGDLVYLTFSSTLCYHILQNWYKYRALLFSSSTSFPSFLHKAKSWCKATVLDFAMPPEPTRFWPVVPFGHRFQDGRVDHVQQQYPGQRSQQNHRQCQDQHQQWQSDATCSLWRKAVRHHGHDLWPWLAKFFFSGDSWFGTCATVQHSLDVTAPWRLLIYNPIGLIEEHSCERSRFCC